MDILQKDSDQICFDLKDKLYVYILYIIGFASMLYLGYTLINFTNITLVTETIVLVIIIATLVQTKEVVLAFPTSSAPPFIKYPW